MATSSLQLPKGYVALSREQLDAAVEFVLVVGQALAVHGHGRATDDTGLLICAHPANATRVSRALLSFGVPEWDVGAAPATFTEPRYGYRIGQEPAMAEILTSIDGISFEDALFEAILTNVEDLLVPVFGRAALIANKRASGRPRDAADLKVVLRATNG